MSLNPVQHRAVDAPGGPVLVVACAGSGKTRVLTQRVARLVERGVQPERILLLTFTRRAAREMLERAAAANPAATQVDGGTFHSFAMRMVSSYHSHLQLPRRPTLIDTDDAGQAIAAVTEELNLSTEKGRLPSKSALQQLFSLATNKGISVADALEELYPTFLERTEEIEAIRKAYARYKLEKAYVDFDDLLVLLLVLLRNPATRKRIQRRYDHVLVDEYQDTNQLQAKITQALVADHGNLTVVGDDAQSIYAWRGARVGNILDFPEQFSDTEVINLEDNYRSSQAILDTANAVLQGMSNAFSKNMRAATGGTGSKPRLHVFEDGQQESEYIANQLQAAIDAGESLKDYAVLFRTTVSSLPLQAELTRRKIPFELRGGMRLTDAAHVKDVFAYLRVLHNPFDELAWLRMLQLLPRIGSKTAMKLYGAATAANATSLPSSEAGSPFQRLLQVQVNLPARSAYREPLGELARVLNAAHQGAQQPITVYDAVLKHYQAVLVEKFDNPERRMEDLEFLRTIVKGYGNLEALLADFTLDPISSKQGAPNSDEEWDIDPVILSTIHSAKGLEWPNVFLIGVSDGVLPSYRAIAGVAEGGTSETLEEEKRLLYVAITRAMRHLDITFPLLRRNDSGVLQDISRFLTPPQVAATLEQVQHSTPQVLTEDDVLDAMSGGLLD